MSIILGVDDPKKYGSKRVLTHIGDAQGVALVQRLLDSTRSTVDLSTDVRSFRPNVDYVNLGGPAFNSATKQLFESLDGSWALPFGFCYEENKWMLRGSNFSFGLKLSEAREVEEDVGLIARLPHPGATGSANSGPFAIVLAGLSTYGTLGATRFSTDPGSIQLLRKRLESHPKLDRSYFCALVRVKPRKDLLGIEPQSLDLLDVRPVRRDTGQHV
jgi:hypothetical protein